MLPLRYPRLWLSFGWLLVLAVIVGSLLPAPIVREITPAISDKLMHFGAYFVLMVWFAGLYPRGKHVLLAVALVLSAWLLEGWCLRVERLAAGNA